MTDASWGERPRKATGPDRQTYFDAGDVDRVMGVVLALVSEVAALRERLDTHERLADAGAPAKVAAVEAYRADDTTDDQREVWRDAYIHRLFRVITEDVEALRRGGEAT